MRCRARASLLVRKGVILSSADVCLHVCVDVWTGFSQPGWWGPAAGCSVHTCMSCCLFRNGAGVLTRLRAPRELGLGKQVRAPPPPGLHSACIRAIAVRTMYNQQVAGADTWLSS
jgi:hypothetical protein